MPRNEMNSRSLRNQRNESNNVRMVEEEVIDLEELWQLFKRKFFLLIIAVVIFAGAGFGYAKYMITPTYSSTGSIYLTPLVNSAGGADYSSLSSNSKLVSNVVTLLQQKDLLSQVAEASGVSGADYVKRCLSVTNVEETEVVKVTAVTTDPRLSKKIAKNTIEIFIDMMKDNLNVKNIEIVDSPRLNFTPVGPNIKKYTVMGAAFGCVLYGVYLVLLLLTDNRIKTKDYAEKYLGLPVLGEFPKRK